MFRFCVVGQCHSYNTGGARTILLLMVDRSIIAVFGIGVWKYRDSTLADAYRHLNGYSGHSEIR